MVSGSKFCLLSFVALLGHPRIESFVSNRTGGSSKSAGGYLDASPLSPGECGSFEQANKVSQKLAAMSYQQRSFHPCIGQQRADLVIAGCAIFDAICRTWPVGELRVADRGLREGILHSLMQAADQEGQND